MTLLTDGIIAHSNKTMADRIESSIRQEIINGTIAPGTRLRVADLSARYGVSHIPVREALRQLEGDRLVTIESFKGAVLRGINIKFVADMHDTRAAIEALLVRNAALKATEQQLEHLQKLRQTYEDAAAMNETARMVQANIAFHRHISFLADNPEAARLMDQGWELVIGIRQRFGFGSNRVSTIIDEHRRLADAIQNRDPVRAVDVAQEHCNSAKDDLLVQMERAGIAAS
ncbi:MAG: GntR family transcriptional regulator [Phyllobacterium sp.]